MKKKIYTFLQFSLAFLLFISFQDASAQGGVYFREGFENGSGWPTSSASAIPVQAVVTATSGTFYTFGGYVSAGPTGSCTTETGGPYHIRFANQNSLGGTADDSSYILTPLANAGIFDISYINGRAGRRVNIFKTSDTDPATTNWVLVQSFPTDNVACQAYTVPINDANAKRLKIMTRSGTDSDLDTLVMRSISPLPTRFGALQAVEKAQGVDVAWNTFNESNLRGYYIQRSADGNQFDNVSFVEANNALEASYQYADRGIFKDKVIYYRIKGVDTDGKITYSPVTKISLQSIAGEGIYMVNPVRGTTVQLQVNGLKPGNYQVAIRNLVGGSVASQSLNVQGSGTSLALKLPGSIATGFYIVTIYGDHYQYTRKIMIE